jgi:hypothetical protein
LKGEARIYEDARISILPSGEIKMDSYMTTPRLVASLRKTK